MEQFRIVREFDRDHTDGKCQLMYMTPDSVGWKLPLTVQLLNICIKK